MMAERDLVFSDEPAEIRQARLRNTALYDRIQHQISGLNPSRDRARTESLLRRLQELHAERAQLAERVKEASPRLTALKYPRPLDLDATRHVLDTGSVLLSYWVGPDRTLLFVVQAAGIEPGLVVLPLPIGEKALRSEIDDFRQLIQRRSRLNLAALRHRSRRLYDVLIRPAEASIASSKRVLFAPDGALHILPFAALLRDGRQYLAEWKPIHTIASATVYAELKKSRDTRRDTGTHLLAFGDPLYRRMDFQPSAAGDPDVRGLFAGSSSLRRLPFSRYEVNAVAGLFPGRSHTYINARATEERAKTVRGPVRYIHFATHGIFDERFPLNSGLMLTVPDPAVDKEKGFLQVWEIFEQVRWETDLVTLSACETGLGKDMGAEGLLGLTRALQYAGARSVLASLGNVEDQPTADLMVHFDRYLKRGKSKDEALRTAQLALIRSPGTAHPFY